MENSKKILVVDDSTTIARVMEIKLKAYGLDVRVASNGNEALKALEEEEFDLITLDLIMPEMDGISVLIKLKEMGIKTPVIVTSNLGQSEDLDRVKELGAIAYLIKTEKSIEDIVRYIKEASE